ncbi:hypothetical protein D3C71_926310 [compost metagenome]
MIRRRRIDQFADQHRRLPHAAIARIGAEVTQVEHVLRRGEQLQEQETVVLAQRAVTVATALGAEFGSQAAQARRRVATREIAIVQAQHADHSERQQPHRHHPAKADATGQQRRAGIGLGQHRGEMRTHHLGRYRCIEAGFFSLVGEFVDELAQAIQRALRRRFGRRFRQQRHQQAEQALAPLRGRECVGQRFLVTGQHAQQADQGI